MTRLSLRFWTLPLSAVGCIALGGCAKATHVAGASPHLQQTHAINSTAVVGGIMVLSAAAVSYYAMHTAGPSPSTCVTPARYFCDGLSIPCCT
jgi:hypothetical protein